MNPKVVYVMLDPCSVFHLNQAINICEENKAGAPRDAHFTSLNCILLTFVLLPRWHCVVCLLVSGDSALRNALFWKAGRSLSPNKQMQLYIPLGWSVLEG